MNELVDSLIEKGVLKTDRIIEAFRKTDRINFVQHSDKKYAYQDRPLRIGEDQTISQPLTVAFMLEQLQPQKGNSILDIGSGSGWTTALLSNIVGKKGEVTGLEIKSGLVKVGQSNLKKLNIKNAQIKKANKNELGMGGEKFDKILVSAAAKNKPKELYKQLKKPGTLVIPINNSIFRITKDKNGKINRQEFFGFSFVPLIH